MARRKRGFKRYDSNHVVLQSNEYQRKDGLYLYKYINNRGEKRVVYSHNLKELREKEQEILQAQADGVASRFDSTVTVNDIFALYMRSKMQLKETTRHNYQYLYDRFIYDDIGKLRVTEVKYTKVKAFYYRMIQEKNVQISSLEIVHTMLHSIFTLALRDELIRRNPTSGVMAEIKKEYKYRRPKKHALTEQQQERFIKYVAKHDPYHFWYPLFVVLLGTGCRIGEIIGLTWEDCDFSQNIISINHNMVYDKRPNGKYGFYITTPKTQAGQRIIPMLTKVRETLLLQRRRWEWQDQGTVTIDGYTNFVFTNRRGHVHNPATVNRAMYRLCMQYNEEERMEALEEQRAPILLPHISVHNLRHTFCSRFCENETNVKVIQEIMGHSDIGTTMNIYAEVTEEKKQDSFRNLEEKLTMH